jgi:hypothetical protein
MGVSVFLDNLKLGPNQTQTWFDNHRDSNKIRLYSAIPIEPNEKGVPANHFDAKVEIAQVYELLFGTQHAQADVGNLQVNVSIKNLTNQTTYCRVMELELP